MNDSAPPTFRAVSVDLRRSFERYGLERRRQGNRPTCSVFTVTGALEYAVARARGYGTRLSVEYLNWAGHQAANRTADGGFFSELWDGYAESGICPEEMLPYRSEYDAGLAPGPDVVRSAVPFGALGLRLHWIKEWNPETGLSDSEFDRIVAVLNEGWPVLGGFRWPKNARWDDDVLQVCPPEEVFDGHSVLLVGCLKDAGPSDGGEFIIRNSGGDGRDGFMPLEYARRYMNDAAWIESGSVRLMRLD